MNTELLIALITFCFVSSITPGPNNLMLLSSGLNFGLRRSISHLLGVAIGFSVMVLLVGIGVSQLFQAIPASYTVLKWGSIVYLCYLAYKIANNHTIDEVASDAKPLTFMQAALFQWVNPKAWTMALSVNAVYASDQSLQSVMLVSVVFLLINLPSIGCWLVLGKSLKQLIASPIKIRLFNWLMAALLVVSVIPML